MQAVLLLFLSTIAAQEKKLPVPDPAAQKESEKLIREVFKEDYAKKSPADRMALARKILQQGIESKDDPNSRYALLTEAKDVALAAGDFETALKAVEETGKSFEGETSTMKAGILTASGKAAKTPDEFLKQARSWLALADEAAAAEMTDVAEKAASEASAFAKRAKDVGLVAKADAKVREIGERKAKAEKLKKARETLTAKPDDPAANLLVGLYECYVKANWEEGLPLLAKGSDPALKDQAARDLAKPTEAAAQGAVGDGWWDASEKETGSAKETLKTRARVWYARALPGLAGLQKAKVAKRVGDPLTEKYGGTWIDVTDPSLFGLAGKAGEPIVVEPAGGKNTRHVSLDKIPPGEYDGFTARVRYDNPDQAVMGMVLVEGYTRAAYVDPTINSFITVHADGAKWVRDQKLDIAKGASFTITMILNATGDYVVYLDGKEMARHKAATGKLTPVGLQAQFGKVIYDQVKLRRKE